MNKCSAKWAAARRSCFPAAGVSPALVLCNCKWQQWRLNARRARIQPSFVLHYNAALAASSWSGVSVPTSQVDQENSENSIYLRIGKAVVKTRLSSELRNSGECPVGNRVKLLCFLLEKPMLSPQRNTEAKSLFFQETKNRTQKSRKSS